MKIAVSSDHAGFALKEEVKALLEQEGHEVLDFGPYNEEPCDLSDYVYPASLAVAEGKADRGIFVDGVGYGSALIANKIYGVYAAVCQDPFCAKLARSHSDTNVLCLGGKIIGSALALEIVTAWIDDRLPQRYRKIHQPRQQSEKIAEKHLKKWDEIQD